MTRIETIGFVIEKIRKIESCASGPLPRGSFLGSAPTEPIWPRRAAMMVTPGMVPLSMSRLNASDMRCSRTDDSPSDSGLAWGSGGVFGAGACLAAGCAFMVPPFALFVCCLVLLVGFQRSLAQNLGIEQGVSRKRSEPGRRRGNMVTLDGHACPSRSQLIGRG